MKSVATIFRVLLVCFLFIYTTLIFADTPQDWPVVIDTQQGQITVYQPQPETLQGNILTGRAAVSVQQPGKEPVFGALWFTAQLITDLNQRTFDLQQMKITKIKFAQVTPKEKQAYTMMISQELAKHALHGSLDTLEANLKAEEKAAKLGSGLQTTPPKILFVNYSAVLVVLDGEPKLQAIDSSSLQRVINTPMLMVYDAATKKYYLSSGNAWYSTNDVHGEWKIERNPPNYVAYIVTDNSKPVQNTVPDSVMPKIIVATEPTELISSDGTPQYSPIKDTDLLYMNNTDSDVFLNYTTKQYYVLFSGRWFTSNSLSGPWSFVSPDKLPTDFAKISPDSPKANVLASIPNTPEAEDALLTSQIPQTAAINRSEAKLTVNYNGAPKFKKIHGTKVQYAVNTTIPVLLISNRYYACDNGVWFVADSSNGPWVVADYVPDDVQEIPPDSPVYNVKYVYIYDSTPDVVYVGYTPGYLGFYPYFGTVVFGTGYYYPFWYDGFYYPWPWTYGLGIYYSSFFGWGFGVGWSYPFSYVGYNWHHGWWGDHDWYGHGGWYNYGGFRAHNFNRNVNFGNQINVGRHNFSLNRNINSNVFNRWGKANRFSAQGAPGATSRLGAKGAGGMKGGVGALGKPGAIKGKQNNVFTDKKGNIYRQNAAGLQMNKGKKWVNVNKSSTQKIMNYSPANKKGFAGKNLQKGIVKAPSKTTMHNYSPQGKSHISAPMHMRPSYHPQSFGGATLHSGGTPHASGGFSGGGHPGGGSPHVGGGFSGGGHPGGGGGGTPHGGGQRRH